MQKDRLVYDGTLKHFKGFDIKVHNVRKFTKSKAKMKVVLVIPQDIGQALEVFLARERKMRKEVFFETHSKSASTVAQILLITKCRVEIYVSELDSEIQRLKYKRLKIKTRENMAKFLLFYSGLIDTMADVHLG